MASWIVLQKPISNYDDRKGESYHYPLTIPNGRQISEGDYLICTLTAKLAKDKRRVFGLGRVERIDSNEKEAWALYGWYREFDVPYTFDEIGGDPRNNQTNSINRVPAKVEQRILQILLDDVRHDQGIVAEEQRLDQVLGYPASEVMEWDESLVEAIKEIFASIFRSQNAMKALVPQFGWRGLGNMLGDLGEFLALFEFNLRKAPTGTRDYDAVTPDGQTVQIKTVYVGSTINMRGSADLLLVIRINSDGQWKKLYYGDYDVVKKKASYGKRDNKYSISIKKLLVIGESARGE